MDPPVLVRNSMIHPILSNKKHTETPKKKWPENTLRKWGKKSPGKNVGDSELGKVSSSLSKSSCWFLEG